LRIKRLKEDLVRARPKALSAEVETIDGLKVIVCRDWGQADVDQLLKAARCWQRMTLALLGSETGKLVAAVGKSGLAKGVKAGNII
jgi:hypothetical protein